MYNVICSRLHTLNIYYMHILCSYTIISNRLNTLYVLSIYVLRDGHVVFENSDRKNTGHVFNS